MFTDARFVPKRSVFATVSLGTIQIFTLIQIGLVAACLRRAGFFSTCALDALQQHLSLEGYGQ